MLYHICGIVDALVRLCVTASSDIFRNRHKLVGSMLMHSFHNRVHLCESGFATTLEIMISLV
jgi:hypothetical protein